MKKLQLSIQHSRKLTLFLAITIFFSIHCGSRATSESGDFGQAPDFTLQDTNGRDLTLSDFNGKVVLLDFWATWCPPCRKEVPHFKALHNKYGDQDFEIVGVAVDDERKVKKYVEKEGIPFNIVIADRTTANKYNIRAFPTTFLLDKKGTIKYKWIGYRPQEVFEEAIQKMLKD
ncbi:peroxiredoxin family protein [candidate division CSSED10-310 bacterium]|uniref:Peroxiredoxin family protein n=1 Tax=candidate division CSSED10-310 bacterium TaxID=2855610 RepID=A0ABV6YZM7_UNCC1